MVLAGVMGALTLVCIVVVSLVDPLGLSDGSSNRPSPRVGAARGRPGVERLPAPRRRVTR